MFPYPGGYGASKESDGLVNGNPPQSMANFMSLELSEHRFPLRFDYFALREDSGGAGWPRGGCGTTYGFTVWSDAIVSCLGDRADTGPFGVAGGGEARPNVVEFRTGGKPGARNSAASRKAASASGRGVGPPIARRRRFRRPAYSRDRSNGSDLNLGYVSGGRPRHVTEVEVGFDCFDLASKRVAETAAAGRLEVQPLARMQKLLFLLAAEFRAPRFSAGAELDGMLRPRLAAAGDAEGR